MIEKKYEQVIRQIKEDRQRLLDKYEKAGYKICMPIKYVKKRVVTEVVIFDDTEIDESDDNLFIEPVEKEEKFEFTEESIELEKELDKVEKALKQDTESNKKSWNPLNRFKKKDKK